MTLSPSSWRSLKAALVLVAAVGSLSALGQQAPAPWVVGEVRIAGSGITVSPSSQTVPLNVATVVNTDFGDGTASAPPSWRVRAILDGPVASSAAPLPLTIEERVQAQEAIERVYYAHRIWPKENPSPKPAFEEMMPKAVIEAKVTDYLQKCAALDQYWQRPIQPEQLQAEMDRMAKCTKDPAMLRELFENLGNDPRRIAECLAKPLLADKLIRSWYAYDSRLHADTRDKASQALEGCSRSSLRSWPDGIYQKLSYRVKGGELGLMEPRPDSDPIFLEPDEFRQLLHQTPQLGELAMRETSDSFLAEIATADSPGVLELEVLAFKKRSFNAWWDEASKPLALRLLEEVSPGYFLPALESGPAPAEVPDSWVYSSLSFPGVPEAHSQHAAVWTGTEMIIWGGYTDYDLTNTGARYNPTTDAWVATSTGTNCPTARHDPKAVWTGTEMIVWGGNGSSKFNTGGRYNPLTDSWVATSTGSNCPTGRYTHTLFWTGTQMVVWGGFTDAGDTNTGGRYNPSADTWQSTSTGANCPAIRSAFASVWAGTEMIIWGGMEGSTFFNSGGRYNPVTDVWAATSTGTNCPTTRYGSAAVWSGSEMIVWAGYNGVYYTNGARYYPSTDSWVPVSSTNCPSARQMGSAIWSGTEMIIWGGWGGGTYLNTGGRYDPVQDSWTATSTGSNCPVGRNRNTAVWTETEMIIWGGGYNDASSHYLNTGGRYNPSTDSWVPTSLSTTCPAARSAHVSAWTGVEFIVWGGYNGSYLNDGGKYCLATDTWIPTSTGTNCPSARAAPNAVWTGTEMIIWGGYTATTPFVTNTGARYTPTLDTWAATSIGTNCPAARQRHTAVWTGTEMIVWGGYNNVSPFYLNSGGRYTPGSDSWVATPTTGNCPSIRHYHSAVWSGTEMIIWGGDNGSAYLNTGGRYSPTSNAWVATSTGTNCPTGREYHAALWIGTDMLVWGGASGSNRNTGGLYNPTSNSWSATSTGTNCPSARQSATAIWRGTDAIIWGGYDGTYFHKTGGRYDPSTNAWATTPTGGLCPGRRGGHVSEWTGSRMIVWGGYSGYAYPRSGGLYFPPCASKTSPAIASVTDINPCAMSGVVVTFTAGYPATRNDLYVDGALALQNVTSPLTYYPGETANHSLTIRTTNGDPLCYVVSSATSGADHAMSSPGSFMNAAPPDAVTGMPLLNVVLDWADSPGATTYDLHFGPSAPPPLFQSGLATSSYIVPGPLPNGTVHYWHIVARNDCGTLQGSQWSFATYALGQEPKEVPEGSLKIFSEGSAIRLAWDPACGSAADYTIYEGDLDALHSGAYTHTSSVCSDTNGDFTETLAPSAGNRYYLVVPKTAGALEGGYGFGRPPGANGAGCTINGQLDGTCP